MRKGLTAALLALAVIAGHGPADAKIADCHSAKIEIPDDWTFAEDPDDPSSCVAKGLGAGLRMSRGALREIDEADIDDYLEELAKASLARSGLSEGEVARVRFAWAGSMHACHIDDDGRGLARLYAYYPESDLLIQAAGSPDGLSRVPRVRAAIRAAFREGGREARGESEKEMARIRAVAESARGRTREFSCRGRPIELPESWTVRDAASPRACEIAGPGVSGRAALDPLEPGEDPGRAALAFARGVLLESGYSRERIADMLRVSTGRGVLHRDDAAGHSLFVGYDARSELMVCVVGDERAVLSVPLAAEALVEKD